MAALLLVTAGYAKRKQWTEKQAWKWQEQVGVIKGFNAPYPTYPGQTNREILQKAAALGFNSVRFWIRGNNTAERVEYIQRMIDDADDCGMTVSPVIAFAERNYYKKTGHTEREAGRKAYEKAVREVVRSFAKERRIVFWDLWNEPRFEDREDTYQQIDIIEQMVHWCWEEELSQPITSSIIWATINTGNQALKRTSQVEAMMDIHNFHSYDCALNFGHNIYEMLDYIKSISDRPMVATECLTRTNGSGLARTFAAFAKYRVNFYIWGLYVNDCNWEARWDRSTYDPYDPMFHNVLYSDGDLYDAREIELLRNYHFAEPGEETDPGIEITDRWSHERAWRWMVTGPLKGLELKATPSSLSMPKGSNAVKVKLKYKNWKDNRLSFFEQFDALLKQAEDQGVTVVPTLADDADAKVKAELLGEYVGDVIGHYYSDTRIKAWNLYDRPGLDNTDTQRLTELVRVLFRYARNQFANQPLTMTPVVSVKPFEKDFDPWKAMIHGRKAGWDRLSYSGGSTADLVYLIWSLSDVTSFATEMPSAETRWLASICYRFGRPIFCMSWAASKDNDVQATLNHFADFHVFWFADMPLVDLYPSFRFTQTSTQRQITEGM
mgnify:CR=1 FL=1